MTFGRLSVVNELADVLSLENFVDTQKCGPELVN